MMKPLLFLAVIAGGVSGTFTFQLLGAGLRAAASPGSIIAILGMTPKGGYLPVIAGVAVATAVSFLVSMVIIKADNKEEEDFEASQAAVKAAKAESKGQVAATTQAASTTSSSASFATVDKIIFACDAGMGSSAMGASVLRNKVKKAGLDVPVSNSAINNLTDDPKALIVTQVELKERASQKAPSALFITVENFMNSPSYDEIVTKLQEVKK